MPRRGEQRSGRPRAVRVEARAKLNLGLAVGPRRPDGYHEIATFFQSITLHDTLEIRPRRHGFRLAVRFEEAALRGGRRKQRVPQGGGNLVVRAAQLSRDRWGFEGGADFRLTKRIPVGAGLGGGSADAAAVLVGLARLSGRRPPTKSRVALGSELGSDVPFALRGGTALGTGRGERLQSLRLVRPFRALVAMPSWEVSTASAYRRIDRGRKGLTGWGAKLRFAQRLGRDEVTAIRCLRLGNSFESVLGEKRVAFASLTARLRRAGLGHVRMTGSGSAVFGIVPPGGRVESVIGRFDGNERLYAVGSTRSSLRVVLLPE